MRALSRFTPVWSPGLRHDGARVVVAQRARARSASARTRTTQTRNSDSEYISTPPLPLYYSSKDRSKTKTRVGAVEGLEDLQQREKSKQSVLEEPRPRLPLHRNTHRIFCFLLFTSNATHVAVSTLPTLATLSPPSLVCENIPETPKPPHPFPLALPRAPGVPAIYPLGSILNRAWLPRLLLARRPPHTQPPPTHSHLTVAEVQCVVSLSLLPTCSPTWTFSTPHPPNSNIHLLPTEPSHPPTRQRGTRDVHQCRLSRPHNRHQLCFLVCRFRIASVALYAARRCKKAITCCVNLHNVHHTRTADSVIVPG